MIKQRREGRGVYIRSYGQLTVMMSFSYERENFFSAIHNMEAALVLEDFECDRVILSYIKPDIFTDDEWDYLLPYLEENDLLNKQINMFYRDYKDPFIVQVVTDTLKTWFYSDYYVKLLYKISDHTYKPPSEIEDLFIDNGACLNAIYISDYSERT